MPALGDDRGAPVKTGLACKCPRCGRGRLFHGFLDVAERCEVCALDFSQHDSGDASAFFIVMVVGFLIVGLALVVEVNFGPPLWLHMVVWLPASLVLPLVMLRPSKAVMIALQYRHGVDFNQ
jgi:uncharacterized protein (DUF983 family)